MKKVVLFNQDGDGLFESLPQNISAEVLPVVVGGIKTDFYKLVADYDGKYSFLVGLFRDKTTATQNLLDLHKTLKKAKHGRLKYDGWIPSDDDNITALELLDELEFQSR